MFPKVRVKGEKVHMELHHHELVQYEESLDSVIQRYLNRWRWLLQGTSGACEGEKGSGYPSSHQ